MPADSADLIWIEEAAEVYGRSRQWLDKQVQEGRLSYASIPGDKRRYLLRSELEALLKPHVQRMGNSQQAG